jgi:prepilin-type N-terminal cleavage/methylation domain-containing protein
MNRGRSESGFSLIELLVATTLLLVVSAIVTTALMQMTTAQKTIWNRTEMHSGVRGATELMQQEVGQAGRVTLPNPLTLVTQVTTAMVSPTSCNPATPAAGAQWVTVSSASIPVTSGIFVHSTTPVSYEMLTVLDGDNQESFRVADKDATRIYACFNKTHPVGATLTPLGGFATGIIPDSGMLNPSTDKVLKMYGDINGDGNMVYVEYTCDWVTTHNLYRNVTAFDAATKLAVTDSNILLSNIYENPGLPPTPCFKYQTSTINITVNGTPTPFTFVLDVAITLTVETEQVDPVTKRKQKETKALLNVSPRNVFNSWALAGMSYTDRIQSTPASVTALLAPLP